MLPYCPMHSTASPYDKRQFRYDLVTRTGFDFTQCLYRHVLASYGRLFGYLSYSDSFQGSTSSPF